MIKMVFDFNEVSYSFSYITVFNVAVTINPAIIKTIKL